MPKSNFDPTGSQAAYTTWERINNMLSTDFCPSLNKYIDWMKHPLCPVLTGITSSLLLALFLNRAVFWVMLGISVVVILGIVWPWVSVRNIRGEMILETRRGQINKPVKLSLKLSNRWPWPLWGLVVAKGFYNKSQQESGLSLSRMPGWSTSTFHWIFTPNQRGVYPLETPQIETSFPFGLFTCRVQLECKSQLVIWPETVELDGLPESTSFHFQERQLTDRKAGDVGDLIGTRDFREGDSLRRIHWGQTARMQSLIVCERQTPATTSVDLILDANQGANDSLEKVERLISTTASIVSSLVKQHASVTFHLNGKSYAPHNSLPEYEKFMDQLARIPIGGYVDGVSAVIPKQFHSQSVIVVASSNSPLSRKGLSAEDRKRWKWIEVDSSEEFVQQTHGQASKHHFNDTWQTELQCCWRKGCFHHV